jgi:hypothetical protein
MLKNWQEELWRRRGDGEEYFFLLLIGPLHCCLSSVVLPLDKGDEDRKRRIPGQRNIIRLENLS